MKGEIDVQLASEEQGIPSVEAIVRYARGALAQANADASLAVRIVGEDEGARLNERYRTRKGATNVLSFTFDAPQGVAVDLIGDVVICAPIVLREAKEQNKSVEAHFAHMVVHGVLHLLGYDHQTNEEALDMEEMETGIIESLGFPNPYSPAGAP